MSVSYDSKKIVPAPLININKTYQKTGDGSKAGVLFNISANGTLVPFKGSPSGNYSDINDAFWTLGGNPPDEAIDVTDGATFDRILRKQEALRDLFKTDGKSFEWQPAGGQPVVKCNPRFLNISFAEGTWADKCEYTLELESDWIHFTSAPSGEDIDLLESELIQSANENWSFEEIQGFEGVSFNVTHSVSAKGILGYDENGVEVGPAWQNAKNWTDLKAIGSIDSTLASGAVGFGSFTAGSFTKSTTVDEKTGDYSVTESWILSSGNTYLEENFSCNKNLSDETFSARYEGTIFGVQQGERSGGSQAVANAKAQVPTNAEAKTTTENAIGSFLEGNVLGVTPTTKSISVNNANGSVNFSFDWTADEDETFSRTCEVSLDFNKGTNIYTLRLTCNIQGIGDTADDKLNNAKAAILSNAAALALAQSLVGDALPAGVTIITAPVSTSSSFNENDGSVRTGSTWTSATTTDPQITVQTTFPKDVSVKILIPGRASGPAIQDMGTQTERIITVVLNSENNSSKPSNAVMIALMNSFAEQDFNVGDAATWILDNDNDNYNHNTGKYTRTRVYTVR
jgi:hypothetical protein